MWKLTLMLVVSLLFAKGLGSVPKADTEQESDDATTIKELNFCALTLRNYINDDENSREMYVLIDPEQITETSLAQLFEALSKRYSKPFSLEVTVYTSIKQLRTLVTGMGISHADKIEGKHRSAYYKRTVQVELFRYNPDFPEPGMKTIVLRGKE